MHQIRHWRRLTPLAILVIVITVFLGPVLTAGAHAATPSLVGPKSLYVALGDSLGFGFQPDLDFAHGYTTDFYHNLQSHNEQDYDNLACPGESSTTFLNGNCPYPLLRKYLYLGSQLNAALQDISAHQGQVSPVTLTLGANDILPDITESGCVINTTKFASDLATLDANLTHTILPQLHAALLVNGTLTGDLIVMNYYDPYQNECPNTIPYLQQVNQHIASDAFNYAHVVDVFGAFGGAAVPNANICNFTWMCSFFHNIHAQSQGYSVIASAFENEVGY